MRAARWAAVVAALCLAVTAVAVAYAAGKAKAVPVAEAVRAERFELVGDGGCVLASLTSSGGESPMVRLRDRNGTVRAVLALSSDGVTYLEMNDRHGRRQVALRQGQHSPTASTAGAELTLGQGRVYLGVTERGAAGLGLWDREGRPRGVLGATGIESAETGVVEQREESSLVLFDAQDRVLWKSP